MDVCGTPRVRMIAPRIRTRLDRDEAVATVIVGQAASRAREVGIDRSRMPVDLVAIAAGRIRLPDLDQSRRNRLSCRVDDPARDDDPLSQRLALVLAGEVVVELADRVVAKDRPGQLGGRVRQQEQRAFRPAELRRAIVRVEVGRVRSLAVANGLEEGRGAANQETVSPFAGFNVRSASSSSALGGSPPCGSGAKRRSQPVAPSASSMVTPG